MVTVPQQDLKIWWASYTAPASGPDIDLGLGLTVLFISYPDWVHRRVEGVHFIGERRVRRSVSIDFSLPDLEPPSDKASHLVPLTLLRKTPLTTFDLRGEAGESLPVLTRDQNGWAAWSLLAAVAQLILNRDARADALELMRELVFARPEENPPVRDRLLATEDGQTLASNAFFIELIDNLEPFFLLLAPIKAEPGRRRILKFSYDEAFSWEERTSPRLLEKFGWSDTEFLFQAPGVGYGGTFHFELEAPPGLEITNADLVVQSREGSDRSATQVGPVATAHLYISDVPRGSEGAVSIWMRPERRGIVRGAILVSLLTAALLAAPLPFEDLLDQIKAREGSAGSLLLAVPGLLSAFIARPGEHEFVSRMLLALRGGLLLTGLASYIAAITLVVGPSGYHLRVLWAALAFLAWLGFVSAAGAYFNSGRSLQTYDVSTDKEEEDDGQSS